MPYRNSLRLLFGRRNRDRTCDFCLVRAALSQLSYPPDFQRSQKIFGMLSTLLYLVNDNGALFLQNLKTTILTTRILPYFLSRPTRGGFETLLRGKHVVCIFFNRPRSTCV